MTLIYNATFDKNTRKLSFEDKAGNEIYSFTVPERGPAVDDITKPLTFKATQDGSTVKLIQNEGSIDVEFQTSTDGGNTWADYTLNTAITLNTGDEVSFLAKSRRSIQTTSAYFQFEMTGKIEAWHNVTSLYCPNDFATNPIIGSGWFSMLFKDCTSLTKAPVLPSTHLSGGCYDSMFWGCTSLTEAPALPATRLANGCYLNMFYGCKSLTKSPELMATELADNCYAGMFRGCSSLDEVRCKVPSSYGGDILRYTEGTGPGPLKKPWLDGVSSTGTFYTNSDAYWPSGANGIPEGWTRVNERAKDDITKPLTFKATQDGSTVTLKKDGLPSGSFQTSRDGGNTWADYTIDDVITLNIGDEVSFRTKSDRTSGPDRQTYFYFMMEGEIEAWHNVMSMIRTNDFATYNTVVDYAFIRLFKDCASLTKAPALPATTLALYCYYGMFSGCQSLTKAPVLPATKLAQSCYRNMFSRCQSLTQAPLLPATILLKSCYYYMFSGCQSLKEVRIAATTMMASDVLSNWLKGVSATGDFYYDPNATIPSGESGIPANWVRHNIADYPTT